MQRSLSRSVRSSLLPSFLRKKKPPSVPGTSLTKQQQVSLQKKGLESLDASKARFSEKLREKESSLIVRERKGAKRFQEAGRDPLTTFSSLEISQSQKDAIRARGVSKYMYNYKPPSNASLIVEKEAKKILEKEGHKSEDIRAFSLAGHNSLKFKDLCTFYSTPVSNTNDYVRLARDERNPDNLTIIENAVRFHPEDVEAFHGGITAFPGQGGEVLGLRNKRLFRQFKPKEKWFDYEEQAFDYTRPDAKMPWDPEMVKKMDSFADKRYNLSTKKFRRNDKQKNLEMENLRI